ncbi:MAG: HEPN domain-containing protein [Thermoplasmata archaeon]
MEGDEEVQEYYSMSLKYLQAGLGNLSNDLYEPAMANGIHALELAMKAALCLVVKGPIKTHNIGGLFGKHFRERLGEEICRSANLILTKYNLPRYPGQRPLEESEVRSDIDLIRRLIEEHIRGIIAGEASRRE